MPVLTTGAGNFPAIAAGGSVTVDVVGTQAFQANSNNFTKTPITITGGLTNPGLICVISRGHASNNVGAGLAVTWNGVPMMLLKQQNGVDSTQSSFIFGLRNPASGSQNLVVTATNVATDNMVNCASFSNVNPASDAAAFPNATGVSNAATLSVTSASGHIAIGSFHNGGSLGTILGTIIMSDAANGTFVNGAGDYVVSSGASTTVGTSATQAAIAGVDVSN